MKTYLHEWPVLKRFRIQKYSREVAREIEIVLRTRFMALFDDCMKHLDAVSDPVVTFGWVLIAFDLILLRPSDYLVHFRFQELVDQFEVASEVSTALTDFLYNLYDNLGNLILLFCLSSEPKADMDQLKYYILARTRNSLRWPLLISSWPDLSWCSLRPVKVNSFLVRTANVQSHYLFW